jgi:hypothetical protein
MTCPERQTARLSPVKSMNVLRMQFLAVGGWTSESETR